MDGMRSLASTGELMEAIRVEVGHMERAFPGHAIRVMISTAPPDYPINDDGPAPPVILERRAATAPPLRLVGG